MRAIFPPPRAMVRVFVVLLLLQDVFCVRALARTTMVRVVLRVRSKFGEREREFLFFWRRCGGSAPLSPLPFFFRFFSLFLSSCLPPSPPFWRLEAHAHSATNDTPQRKKRRRSEKKSIATAVVLRTHGPNHPVLVFSLSLSVSLCLKIWFLLSR